MKRVLREIPCYLEDSVHPTQQTRLAHEYVSNNRSYKKFQDFKEAYFAFFECTLPTIKDVLVRRVTDNFSVIGF